MTDSWMAGNFACSGREFAPAPSRQFLCAVCFLTKPNNSSRGEATFDPSICFCMRLADHDDGLGLDGICVSPLTYRH